MKLSVENFWSGNEIETLASCIVVESGGLEASDCGHCRGTPCEAMEHSGSEGSGTKRMESKRRSRTTSSVPLLILRLRQHRFRNEKIHLKLEGEEW